MLGNFNPNQIQDLEGARVCIVKLLNLVEQLQQGLSELRKENQQLRDEINRLKGEQGKPKIKPKGKDKDEAKPGSTDYSSEQERHKPKRWQKGTKNNRVKIHETRPLEVDAALLPEDAQFKGYEDVVVQDIRIQSHNTCFQKEKHYSPSKRKTYLADLPPGYEGGYGPGVRALVLTLYFSCNMSQPKILNFLRESGLLISRGQLSNMIVQGQDGFHAEKDAVYEASLANSPWQQIDETGMHVQGQCWHCHIVCNPTHTTYFTMEQSNRLTTLDLLRNFRERSYLLNAESSALLEQVRLAGPLRQKLKALPHEQILHEERFLHLLAEHLPELGPQQRRRIQEAAGIAAYHVETGFPVTQLLVADDAGQFKVLTEELSLCWVHDGRHYKKMSPFVECHRRLLEDFRKRYWTYYDRLLQYKKSPSEAEARRLGQDFDDLFSTVTGFHVLDERIARTKAHKSCLLMVLKHPEIPLHNNAAELGARQLVRKRDVSFGVRSAQGRRAWDTFLSLTATTRKLGISFFQYIHDRICQAGQIPPLAELIAERSRQLRLGASWNQGP